MKEIKWEEIRSISGYFVDPLGQSLFMTAWIATKTQVYVFWNLAQGKFLLVVY